MSDITVNLYKERGQSLGIGFSKLPHPPFCQVSILVANGVAAECGLISEGDLLLSVNGVNVQHLNPNEVGGVLARHSTDSTITLELRQQMINGNMNDITNIEEPIPNGHPQIIVDPIPPPENINTTPTKVRHAGRVRRTAESTLPEIKEDIDKDNNVSNSLDVQPQPVHRHSLTPKPVEDMNRSSIRSSKSLDLANLPQWRAGTVAPQTVTLHNLLNGHEMSDRLHMNACKVGVYIINNL